MILLLIVIADDNIIVSPYPIIKTARSLTAKLKLKKKFHWKMLPPPKNSITPNQHPCLDTLV